MLPCVNDVDKIRGNLQGNVCKDDGFKSSVTSQMLREST